MAGCDVAYKSDSFTRAVYKGLVELTVLAADELSDPSAGERMISGSGVDLYVSFGTNLMFCRLVSDTQVNENHLFFTSKRKSHMRTVDVQVYYRSPSGGRRRIRCRADRTAR